TRPRRHARPHRQHSVLRAAALLLCATACFEFLNGEARMKDEARPFISGISNILRDVWLVWLAVGLITTTPYVLANQRTPTGHNFTGVLTAYDDTFTYF